MTARIRSRKPNKPNYRVITVSTENGSLFDIAEFENFAEVLDWTRSGRLAGNLHTFCVDISADDPSMHYTLSTIFVTDLSKEV